MPSMKWHPTTGENQVFGADDPVPEGWLDHHPQDTDKATAPVDSPDKPLTKKEVVEALKAGGIEFDGSAKVDELTATLVAALEAALTEGKVEFAEDASPRALLALVSVN